MAKIGSIKEVEHPLLQIMRSSDKVDIIYVKYKEIQTNVRLVKRSGRRVGNDVYVDIVRIPIGARVKFKEDNTFEDIWLDDNNFKRYLEGQITKEEYIENKEQPGCLTNLALFMLIIAGIIIMGMLLNTY